MPKTPSSTGYQPRTTPAERRAFFDQQRQIAAASEGDDDITQADADTRYVNVTGDTMTDTLVVNGPGVGLRLQRSTDSPYLSFAKQDGSRMAYIQAHSSNNLLIYNDLPSGQIQFYVEDADGTSKVRLNIHDQGVTLTSGHFHVYSTALASLLHVDDAGVVVDRNPTVPLQVATKQYVDAAPNPTLIRLRLTKPTATSFPAGAATTVVGLTTTEENVGGITVASGVYSVPVAGTYAMHLRCNDGGTIPATMYLAIVVAAAGVTRTAGTGNTNQSVSMVSYVPAASTITFSINNQHTVAVSTIPTIEIVRLA